MAQDHDGANRSKNDGFAKNLMRVRRLAGALDNYSLPDANDGGGDDYSMIEVRRLIAQLSHNARRDRTAEVRLDACDWAEAFEVEVIREIAYRHGWDVKFHLDPATNHQVMTITPLALLSVGERAELVNERAYQDAVVDATSYREARERRDSFIGCFQYKEMLPSPASQPSGTLAAVLCNRNDAGDFETAIYKVLGVSPDSCWRHVASLPLTVEASELRFSAGKAMPTVSVPTIDTHEQTTMSETPSPSKSQPSLVDRAKAESEAAAWRVAALQFTKLTRDPLVGAISRHLAPGDESVRARVAAFLDTEAGKALVAGLLGVTLGALPPTLGPVPAKLAEELRVQSMSGAGDLVADVIMGPLREVMSTYLRGVSDVMPAQPVTRELEAPRRPPSWSDEATSEGALLAPGSGVSK